MFRFFQSLLWLFSTTLLWFRYRIRVHGKEKAKDLKGPLLVLPNHPGFIDPPIIMTTLFPIFHPRPLLFEGNFTGIFYPVMVLLNALRIPDLGQTSVDARQRTAEAIEELKNALRRGENVLLWPSGRVQRAGVEILGAARTLSDVMKAVPEAQIVLVRTRGLWGSRFSYGWDGNRPSFAKRLLLGIPVVLSNLFFFTPRRQVDITLQPIERNALPGLEREVLNPFLEKWYNEGGPEKPTFVPLHCLFGARTHEFPQIDTGEEIDLSSLKDDVRHAVDEMIGEKLHQTFPPGKLTPETMLDHLGMDSLDRMEVSLNVERRFGFHGDQVPLKVGELYALASGLVQRKPPKPPEPLWFEPASTENAEILADTIAEAFVKRALLHPKDVVCADDLSGALSYEKLLVGALLMSKRFRALPGENVGVLLPSSVACDVVLMGLYLAGKLPVVLNWTTGPANLAHAAELMNLQHVVTSKAFVDRAGVIVDGTEYLFLEELRQQIGKMESLWTLLRVRFAGGTVLQSVPRPDPNSPAVVLFTSGSEKAPKAVPLTHRNMLTNQQVGLTILHVKRQDSILGFLPAFHSFGMSITGLLPLLSGLRVVRHPDPTDAAALARKIGMYKPTLLVGTPTFVNYILDRAEPGEMKSLRAVVVGAEKCPQALFDRFKQVAPQAEVLEGYGITECSPVVAVNRPGANKPGTVGKPLPGVEVCVVDLDSHTQVPQGEMGMLLVSGQTIFPGYLGEEKAPFQEFEGKRWYVTGDLVQIDNDGYIQFSGRLKRFIKAGGEMISLPALEDPFTRLYPPTKEGPRVAVEGVELEGGGRKIVLFTSESITLREANEVLVKAGFHGIMRLDEVRKMDTIPVLGTGKTDYKVLRAKILTDNNREVSA